MVGTNVKAETMSLMDKRGANETEMNAIIERLSQPGGPGITGNLVDSEGFPRCDIDIPVVRAERRRLTELRNDHKEITEKINQNIQILHAARLGNRSSSVNNSETMSLMDKRGAMETEMNAIIECLSQPGWPGITGNLVDSEGFPRSDIDIPVVRAERRRLTELRNDHKEITEKINQNIQILHAARLGNRSSSVNNSETMSLMDKRGAMETEMNAIIECLSQPGWPGITGNLVDSEGFPRSDIDIPVVRAERRRLTELRNDHKEITEKINQNIQILHAARLGNRSSSVNNSETMSLMDKRGAMETEMNAIIECLSQPGWPGITGNLVDSEGFPCSDIDIPVVRAERRRLTELRNDHKEITEKINQNIQILHAARLGNRSSSVNNSGNDDRSNTQSSAVDAVTSASSQNVFLRQSPSSMDVDVVVRIPFAMVDEITDASPAAEDGLQLGDQIVKFGNVEAGDNLLQRLASESQSNLGCAIPVVIMRQGALINLTVTPRTWQGRGLLGCHFRIL